MRFPARRLASALLGLAVLRSASPLVAQAPQTGGADHGKIFFQQNCALCHATGQNAQPPTGQGPLLAGVLGRQAGSLPNFGYTKALRDSHLTWDVATLEQFLAGPGVLVPGTAMPVPVTNPVDRRDVVAYLTTLRAVALPANPGSRAAGRRS